MKLSHRSLTTGVLTLGLALAGGVSLCAGPAAGFQDYPAPYNTDLRGLVDRTQADLRAANDLEHGNDKQHERYKNAQAHLSTFDRKLTKGKFDREELKHAIETIQAILDHNVLQASSRDALIHDVTDLKVAGDRQYH